MQVNITILPIIGIVFLTLKLCGVIQWPWLWVLAPFWVPVAIFFTVFLVIFILSVWAD